MNSVSSTIEVGTRLPEHVQGPITRTTLALFAGASNDHVRLHIDSDYAKEAGMPDVFAHGMLSMAYLSQLLTNWVPQQRIRSLHVRFVAITPLHTVVTCRGEVIELIEHEGVRLAKVRASASTQENVVTLDGEAVIEIENQHSP